MSPALLVTLLIVENVSGLLLVRFAWSQHPEWDEEAVHNDEHQVRVQ